MVEALLDDVRVADPLTPAVTEPVPDGPEDTVPSAVTVPVSPGKAVKPEEIDEDVFVFPATPAQRRFWLLDQLLPGGNPALNMPLAVRLDGDLNRDALEQSFNALVQRHEILRTTFHFEMGQLRQVIAPHLTMPVPLVDVRDFPHPERERVPEHLAEEEARLPFDLARGPVFRARLVRVHPAEHVLLFTLHHIVADGWSKGLLLRELGEAYAAIVTHRPSPLPELTIQFADYAQWQHDALSEGKLDSQLTYWREQLAGDLAALDLPVDRPRRVRRISAPGAIRSRTLPAGVVAGLKALGVRERVSQFMIFLAGFAILLHRCSGGQEDLIVGSPSANRDRTEFENLAGLFVNPLLLRLAVGGDPTFREMLSRVRKTVLDAFAHADVPFETIIEEIQPRHLQVNFLYQTSFPQVARLPNLTVTPLGSTSGGALFEWTGAAIEEADRTRLEIEYNTNLFDADTIDGVLDQYAALLAGAAADPASRISCLSSMNEADTQRAWQGAPSIRAPWWRLPAASLLWMERSCVRPPRKPDTRQAAVEIAPRPGIGLLVLDACSQPVPAGATGLIHVRGLTGNDPALPADSSQPDPSRAGEQLFRTADLGFVCHDGSIRWMGPAADGRRVRGFRVDTGRTEAALREHPHIRQAVVLWRGPDNRHLAAYLQSDGGPAALFTAAQMRVFLQERLSEESVPETFTLLERFPLTPDGRLNASALPAPNMSANREERHDAPYLTVHYQLIDLWRQLLGVESIGIRDDFFALGGNSLLAMRMLYRIEQAFGRTLLPSTLFKEATIEHLADEMLQPTEGQPAPSVVKVNDHGAKTPIFYLHGDFHGGGFYCIKLSRSLGGDQPFYALPHLEISNPSDAPATLEATAEIYVQRIRSVRPHGPYVIGGFCLGGLFAYEVARQLAAQGEEIERLLIIDATLENRRLKRLRKMAEAYGKRRGLSADRQLYYFCRWHFLLARLERWWNLGIIDQWSVLSRRAMIRWQGLRAKFKPVKPASAKSVLAGGVRSKSDSDWFDPRWDVPLVFLWAAAGYKAKPYGGRTTLLLSSDMLPKGPRGLREWRKYMSRMDVRELPGSHLACITAYVDELAETVRRSLED